MTIDTQSIKTLLQREAVESESDEQLLCRADDKLNAILQKATADDAATVELIRTYAESNEINKRKLLSFCVNFRDPTARGQQTIPNGAQIQLHTWLEESELHQLQQFVKKHQYDVFFPVTVYEMMDRHEMTPPQVYGNVMMSRQDFSRATDPRGKNVTRRIVWQIIIGLHCTLEEAEDVLFSAGYTMRKTRLDLIMEYFVRHNNYDIESINDVLEKYEDKPYQIYRPVRDDDVGPLPSKKLKNRPIEHRD